MAKLETIEGISQTLADRLRTAGVRTVEALFRAGMTPEGRRKLAESTGISDARILAWVNRAYLMRFRGVGTEYRDLLEHVGVDTVAKLARRNPDRLYEQLVEASGEKYLARRPPGRGIVTRWVEQARIMPQIVS
jgi:predicted RecB family nuclease